MRRDHWKRRHETLDAQSDRVEIYRGVVTHEFPWDMEQALSFALVRTYAVPGIGRLLADTGEFIRRVQNRHDDTALLLEPPTRWGFEHREARAAIRRINQMHHAYDIPDHEMRYVLSTFVVVPKRWLDTYGKRPLTPNELAASVHYYRTLSKHMGIPDLPRSYAEFDQLLDDYETEHFAYDHGGRAVADSTLALMTSFEPRAVRWAMNAVSRAFMDDALLAAFRYDRPPRMVGALARGAMRTRRRLLRLFPARREPVRIEDKPTIRGYPDGYRVEELGTFPLPGVGGCPVRRVSEESRNRVAAAETNDVSSAPSPRRSC